MHGDSRDLVTGSPWIMIMTESDAFRVQDPGLLFLVDQERHAISEHELMLA